VLGTNSQSSALKLEVDVKEEKFELLKARDSRCKMALFMKKNRNQITAEV
jgi:hypothetical protein